LSRVSRAKRALGATLSGAVATAFILRGLKTSGEVAGLPAWLVGSGTAIGLGALLCNSTAKAWRTG
jgi:hypothetical protein